MTAGGDCVVPSSFLHIRSVRPTLEIVGVISMSESQALAQDSYQRAINVKQQVCPDLDLKLFRLITMNTSRFVTLDTTHICLLAKRLVIELAHLIWHPIFRCNDRALPPWQYLQSVHYSFVISWNKPQLVAEVVLYHKSILHFVRSN